MTPITLALAFALSAAPGSEWREFRGPDGTGRHDGPPIVTEWGPDKNVTWAVPVPGKGWSSPIVVGGKVILTTGVPLGDGDKPDQSLRALAFDAATGKQLWDTEVLVGDGKTAAASHAKNTHASPTPVSDGERVWVHYGHLGTACLDFDGKLVWKTQDHPYKPMHGNGGSPILVDDMLVFSGDGNDVQFVVALDKATGKVRWKTDRRSNAGLKFSFSTPQLVTANGRRLVVSHASNFVAAYDVSDGKEVWRAKYPEAGWSVIARPVVAAGRVVVQTGYPKQHLIAIDPAGTGDITGNVRWASRKDAPNTPTPLAVGDDLYVVADNGMMTCLDAATGKVRWAERLRGKAYSASPIYANGLIYVTSEEGVGQAVKAGPAFEEVSRTDMKERTFATFAPAGGALFVRTETTLYRFDRK